MPTSPSVPTAPALSRSLLSVAGLATKRKQANIGIIGIVAFSGIWSAAASRLRFAWTDSMPISFFRFLGTVEKPRCCAVGIDQESNHEQMDPLVSPEPYGMLLNDRESVCPAENVAAKDAKWPGYMRGERDGIDSDFESSVTSEDTSTGLASKRDTGYNVQKHFIFLVHGWMGNEMEMSYIEDALEKAIESSPFLATGNVLGQVGPGLVVVHKVKCNNGKTTDGISAGGARLADEIIETIRAHTKQHDEGEIEDATDERHQVTVSFVGNSLGGLYARYALSLLPARLGKIDLHPNIFCTTATPHLGVASHTYVPIPRVAERVIGRGMGQTGRDLFRLDPVNGDEKDIIYRMSTEDEFLEPLSRFEKRVAYANAYRTDFQVPMDTAAFLSPLSSYPHRLDRTLNDEFVATILHTEKHDWRNFDTVLREQSMQNDILTMSTKLDALGWTKVFVDVRERIPMPSVPLPGMQRRDSRSELKQFVAKRRKSGACNESYVIVESRELVALLNPTERLHFPLGHTVMIANSKSDLYAKLNQQGKPVMDRLASELVEDVLLFGTVDDEENSE